jgi:hypothetical protein
MIDHDITNRISAGRIISSCHIGGTAPEPHKADHHIMCSDPFDLLFSPKKINLFPTLHLFSTLHYVSGQLQHETNITARLYKQGQEG